MGPHPRLKGEEKIYHCVLIQGYALQTMSHKEISRRGRAEMAKCTKKRCDTCKNLLFHFLNFSLFDVALVAIPVVVAKAIQF